MAYICSKPAGSCAACSHYRYDADYGGKACFATQDKCETTNNNASCKSSASDTNSDPKGSATNA